MPTEAHLLEITKNQPPFCSGTSRSQPAMRRGRSCGVDPPASRRSRAHRPLGTPTERPSARQGAKSTATPPNSGALANRVPCTRSIRDPDPSDQIVSRSLRTTGRETGLGWPVGRSAADSGVRPPSSVRAGVSWPVCLRRVTRRRHCSGAVAHRPGRGQPGSERMEPRTADRGRWHRRRATCDRSPWWLGERVARMPRAVVGDPVSILVGVQT